MIGLRGLLCAGQSLLTMWVLRILTGRRAAAMRWVNLIFAAVVANDLECGGLPFDRSGGRITMTAGGQALLP
jgi:hypothetical protein